MPNNIREIKQKQLNVTMFEHSRLILSEYNFGLENLHVQVENYDLVP